MFNQSHKVKQELFPILVFIASIWLIFILDLFLPLEKLGLVPRSIAHLPGIVAMPFLQSDLSHITSNTPPLIRLMTLLAGSKANSKVIVATIILLGGLLLWLFGRGYAIHIGASGLVVGLATFLIISGLMEKRLLPMIISIVVAVLYGSTIITGVLPLQKSVSWDGHLMGGIAGAISAWVFIKLVRYK